MRDTPQAGVKGGRQCGAKKLLIGYGSSAGGAA